MRVRVSRMHEELLAQRAVDRHLTEELIRFRTIVGVLTNELSELKMLENKNRREALRAQQEVRRSQRTCITILCCSIRFSASIS